MNEVFMRAAFGQSSVLLSQPKRPLDLSAHILSHTVGEKHLSKPPAQYSIFDKAELENRVVRVASVCIRCGVYVCGEEVLTRFFFQEILTREVEELQAKAAARQAAHDRDQVADMSVDEVAAIPSIVVA
jgi:hypothetical protein